MRRALPIAATLALCACERADRTKTVELPTPKVTVHVLDPGAEPRAALRASAKVGARATFAATVTGEFDQPRRAPMPTASFTYEAEVVDVANGIIHVRQRVIAASAAEQIGRTFDHWNDARGNRVRASLSELPAGASTDRDSSDPDLVMIAPEEAVGIGARWHEDVVLGDATASIDVELLSREGDRVRERLTFHTDQRILKSPAHRDGTTIAELSLSDPDGSIHRNETFTIEFPQGRAHGTRTSDIVRKP